MPVPPLSLSPPGGPLPSDMAQGRVKSPILPFLGPVGVERENTVLGPTPAAAAPPALQGLTSSLLGSVLSGLQKPKQSENGPPSTGVRTRGSR